MRPPSADDTVIIRPARRRMRLSWVVCAVLLFAAGSAGVAWMQRPSAHQPVVESTIPTVTEAELRAASPSIRTVRRFAANPAIVVVDFPTLTEQGRMLNRMAAWAERAGVPRDRLLDDTELDAAIRGHGDTPETYYYGHDYRAADLAKFFALADAGHVALNPEEQALRALAVQASAEKLGFGALITLPRADPGNQVDLSSRAAILHHELSHGEYFTNPIYAGFVKTLWQTVLTGPERAAFRDYLGGEGYDTGIEDLMMNETQAYLMHTPDRRFFDPSRLAIAGERLRAIREAFVAGMPSCWLRDETSVDPRPL